MPKRSSNYIMNGHFDDSAAKRDVVLFSTQEEVGALAQALKIFQVPLSLLEYIISVSYIKQKRRHAC